MVESQFCWRPSPRTMHKHKCTNVCTGSAQARLWRMCCVWSQLLGAGNLGWGSGLFKVSNWDKFVPARSALTPRLYLNLNAAAYVSLLLRVLGSVNGFGLLTLDSTPFLKISWVMMRCLKIKPLKCPHTLDCLDYRSCFMGVSVFMEQLQLVCRCQWESGWPVGPRPWLGEGKGLVTIIFSLFV